MPNYETPKRARLHVVLDVDVDPTRVDPHYLVDELMPEHRPTFFPGDSFQVSYIDRGSSARATVTWVSAEWDSND